MKVSSESAFPKLSIASSITEAEIAIAAAKKISQVKLFRWRAYAVAINATSQNGSWDIGYYDPLVKAQMANSGPIFRPSLKGYGSVPIKVENGQARVED
jgi:hypothetical protein